jgi:carboxyl-terminal processing protease
MRTISSLLLTCIFGLFAQADTIDASSPVGVCGIGAVLAEKDGSPTVTEILPKSPANRAGLKVDDKIIQVDDTKTAGLTLIQSVKLIRGPQGTEVKILVQRPSEASEITLSVTREPILLLRKHPAATEAPPSSNPPPSAP